MNLLYYRWVRKDFNLLIYIRFSVMTLTYQTARACENVGGHVKQNDRNFLFKLVRNDSQLYTNNRRSICPQRRYTIHLRIACFHGERSTCAQRR